MMAMLTCPKCGQVQMNEVGQPCIKCGEILEDNGFKRKEETGHSDSQAQGTKIQKCSDCGAIQPVCNAKFCAYCGAELKENSSENPTKGSLNSIFIWIIIIFLLLLFGKISHQNWVNEQMEHFRGLDYNYSDEQMQDELDKIFNTFG